MFLSLDMALELAEELLNVGHLGLGKGRGMMKQMTMMCSTREVHGNKGSLNPSSKPPKGEHGAKSQARYGIHMLTLD